MFKLGLESAIDSDVRTGNMRACIAEVPIILRTRRPVRPRAPEVEGPTVLQRSQWRPIILRTGRTVRALTLKIARPSVFKSRTMTCRRPRPRPQPLTIARPSVFKRRTMTCRRPRPRPRPRPPHLSRPPTLWFHTCLSYPCPVATCPDSGAWIGSAVTFFTKASRFISAICA